MKVNLLVTYLTRKSGLVVAFVHMFSAHHERRITMTGAGTDRDRARRDLLQRVTKFMEKEKLVAIDQEQEVLELE